MRGLLQGDHFFHQNGRSDILNRALRIAREPISYHFLELVLVFGGGAVFYPPMVKIIIGSISRDRYALGSSLEETMRLVGNASSMALVTVCFAFYLGGTDIIPENHQAFLQSMRLIIAAFSVLCGV